MSVIYSIPQSGRPYTALQNVAEVSVISDQATDMHVVRYLLSLTCNVVCIATIGGILRDRYLPDEKITKLPVKQ